MYKRQTKGIRSPLSHAAIRAVSICEMCIRDRSYVPYACMFALSGVLRGAGDTVSAMLITLTSLWAVRVPLAATLSRLPGFGINGVWIAIIAGPVTGSILNYAYYKTGRWKHRVVVQRAADVTPLQDDLSDPPS